MLHTTSFYDRGDDSILLRYAKENKEKGYFNDVTIRAGNECFPANRMVLACYSPFFENMFKSGLKERYEKSIEIKYGKGQFIKQLIDFIYFGSISINNSDVVEILEAADFLQLDNIKEVCFNHLEKNLDLENCFDVFELADRYRSPLLKAAVEEFISKNFEIFIDSSKVKSFTKEMFMEWFTKLNQKEIDQNLLYHTILNWIKHDKSRNSEFAEFFQLLNLNEFSSTFLEEVVSKEKLVEDSLFCTNAVLQVISQRLKEIRLAENCTSIVTIGGYWTDKEVLEIFNCFGEAVKQYPRLPKGSRICCSVKFNEQLYVIGGNPELLNGASTTTYLLMLNQKLMKWKEVAAMHEPRSAFSSAVFDKVLYVAGGCNKNNILSSTEYYDPFHKLWQMGSQMKQSRKGHALVAFYGKLLALGGKSGNDEILNSVEQLQSLNGKWELIMPMIEPRYNFVAVRCKGIIYAIGGQCGSENHTTTKSVEKFDPDRNDWCSVKSMNIARSSFSATVLQDRIFVVGGLSTEKIAVKEIECYNPALDSWSIIKNVDQKLFYHSAIAV